jgi:Phosphotransferase enzyme family
MPNDATAAKIALAGQLGRLTIHTIRERIRPRYASTLDEVPQSAHHLTDAWLTAALCRDVPGGQVIDHRVGSSSDGSTSRAALTVTYNDAGAAAGLPTRLFTKSTPKLTSRLMTIPSGALISEAAFYNVIRPALSVEVPTGYYAAVDGRSGRSMFLLEDIAAQRGATFGDPVDLPIDRAGAEDIVSLLASVHGTFWESPRLRDPSDLGWIKSALQFQLDCNAAIGFEKRSIVGAKRAADVIPDEFHRHRDEIWPAFMRSLEMHQHHPMTLLHSDVHSRNWYRTGDGRMGLCDWQIIGRGMWAADLAYALTSNLTIENRRSWERELIELYIDRLPAAGGDKLTFDDAWTGYRQQIYRGLYFWLYTIGHGAMQPDMQPDYVSRANCERMSTAAVDLDTLGALAKS